MVESVEGAGGEGAEPVLDPGPLATVASLQRPGAPDLLGRVLALFADDAPRHVAGVAEGIDALDAERVRTSAHTLKSSAANVGAARLAAACARIERAAREANLVACVAPADGLDALLAETLDALAAAHGPRDASGPDGSTGRRAA